MIRKIAPQFLTTNPPATLAYYREMLGFECLGRWSDPPVYAIVARDEHSILEADALHAECAGRGVQFTRALGDTPWGQSVLR